MKLSQGIAVCPPLDHSLADYSREGVVLKAFVIQEISEKARPQEACFLYMFKCHIFEFRRARIAYIYCTYIEFPMILLVSVATYFVEQKCIQLHVFFDMPAAQAEDTDGITVSLALIECILLLRKYKYV